MNESMDKKLR
jgi:hypothetical protein